MFVHAFVGTLCQSIRSETKSQSDLFTRFLILLLPKGIGMSVTSLVCLFIENLFCFWNIHFKSIVARKVLIVVEKKYIVFALTCIEILIKQKYIVMYKYFAKLYSYV